MMASLCLQVIRHRAACAPELRWGADHACKELADSRKRQGKRIRIKPRHPGAGLLNLVPILEATG
jgi:hypothetical protein